ncbi:hypothetical protein ACOMHN_064284 [Nucella lapillus]
MNISEPSHPSHTASVWSSPFQSVAGLEEVSAEYSDVVSSSSADVYLDINATLWRVVSPVLLVLGTVGNVMTVVVMRGMRASRSSACLSVYFTALAASDQCQLLTAVLFHWVDRGFSWPRGAFRLHLLCSVPTFVYHVGGITSAWFLVAMTYQRVTSVVAPHRVGVLCTVKRGKVVVGVIVIVGVAINCHFLFSYVYRPDYRRCQFHEDYLHLVDYLEWQFTLLYSMVPFLFLVVGNSVLIRQVIRARRLSQQMRTGVEPQRSGGSDRVQSMSITLIVTSVAYLLFTLPPCIFAVYVKMDEINVSENESGAVTELTKSLMTVCWMSATATNFYFYLLSGRKFRQETVRYLCCRHADVVKKSVSSYSGKV